MNKKPTKAENAAKIRELLGADLVLTEAAYTADELATLAQAAAAADGVEETRKFIADREASYDPPARRSRAASDDGDDDEPELVDPITVRVNATIRANGGRLIDPETKASIRGDWVEVERTDFITAKLATKELEEK